MVFVDYNGIGPNGVVEGGIRDLRHQASDKWSSRYPSFRTCPSARIYV